MQRKTLIEATFDEIKNGYYLDSESGVYSCLICGESYETGEIYPIDGRFFEANRAIMYHMDKKHGGTLNYLLELDKKHTGITENQKSLLRDFSEGLSDNEIAKKNGVSPTTIRHQRFMFREKAKQARVYLGIFELVEENTRKDAKDKLINLHSGARMVDERYVLTEAEEEQIIATYFDTINPLKLRAFPTKEKRKIAILRKISTLFEPGIKYTELEINNILKNVFEDIATIRRYLIEYGFMDRTRDCKEYQLKD